MFQVRGRLERDIANRFDEEKNKAAYEELNKIIEKHVSIISRSEKGRLQRERMYFKNNPAQYQRRIDAAKTVEHDTYDNLVKMALHIVAGTTIEKLSEGLENFTIDVEAGTIESRVSHADAIKLHVTWKMILQNYVDQPGNSIGAVFGETTNTSALITKESDELTRLKDELFIQTGEDTNDIFEAFAHYNLPNNPLN